ncbi:uncharacterized protein THITE_2118118 [Thermothielavioides terrestris NRRL 8126]|uniref:2EXR domain-containing protein n=1 Tax=Thermothielavioides terrestris (strain ATCC 38088 / NRRL 8126) TaxID=578455 RepID=G2R736_THETT|nr:uncharacterized protein THITE_2118118 [Thermothielavioides terrestris NRRL 8126]AEO68560.1 hypothetical protein THITE_2118118 [Thermothielavioides terrestris NRRL 8126]
MSDSSEESDHIGYLAEGAEHDEPEEAGSVESGSDQAHMDLLDLEAEDADSDSDGESSGSAVSDAENREPHVFFPQFMRLPIELRHHIWEFFCPDLTAKSRLYGLQVGLSGRGPRQRMILQEGPFLEQQTRPARAVLAVHHESRQLALKAFPDTLSLQRSAIFRFNAKLDVIFLGPEDSVFRVLDENPSVTGVGEPIRQLAVEYDDSDYFSGRCRRLFNFFPNLRTVYHATMDVDHSPANLRWCVSGLVNCYSVTTFEEEPGLGEDATHVFCWPDLENNRSFAHDEIPLKELEWYEDVTDADFGERIVWPMILFPFASSSRRFEALRTWDGKPPYPWDYHSDTDDESGESDEYESEGIDDSYISENDPADLSDDLVVLDDDDSDEEDSSVRSGSQSPRVEAGMIDLTGDDDHEGVANFSSPEQSSATLRGPDESEAESDQPATHRSRLKRRRGRVVESDSEDDDDSEDDVPRKRTRIERGRNPIVLSSDDEEEEEGRETHANRQTRAVLSEDEEEEGDEDDDEESEEVEDDESEGSAPRARPLSLAEKLQLHREEVPIPPSDDGDSEVEEMAGDDYDARDYADFQDDEEGNEIDQSDGDDGNGNGFLTGDGEGDEDDDGYY